jgi:hypothetical protein
LESVEPTQVIDIKENIDNNVATPTLNKSLDALRTLRDSGVISDEEYKTKVLELVK